MGKDSATRYGNGAILLHWLIAALLLFEIALGWRTEAPRSAETFPLFQLHKSIGITILLLTLVRIAWRLTHRPPPFPETMKGWEKGLAHAVHFGFYAFLLIMPLSGWAIVSTSKIAVPTLLYGTVPWPHLPLGHGAHDTAETIHGVMARVAVALFILHVAGALKHHFVDRADDLARMLPGARRLFDWRIAAVLAGVAGLLWAGTKIPLVPAPAPAAAEPAAQASEPVAAALAPAEDEAAAEPANASEAVAVDDKAAASAHWAVIGSKSALGFTTTWPSGTIKGRFKKWDADIVFDPEALDKASVKATIDMASVDTEDDDSRGALPGDDFFAVVSHPRSTFTSKSFRKLGPDRYEAKGTLNLRGVSAPVVLPFTLKIDGDAAHMTGTARIDRTKFGVGQGQWASTDSLPADVMVTIAIEAKRE